MRYLTLLLLVFSFFPLNAQDCPPGSVTINSQAEMDSFAATYPNCTQINGHFTLDGEYDYSSVFPNLPALKRITGTLGFYTNSSAAGFPNLEYVGSISDSYGTVGALPALDTIGGGIWMSEPYGGVGFPSCPQLKYIGGSIQVASSEGGRINSNYFPNVEYIGGDIRDYSDWADSDFSAFTNLRYVGGNLDVEDGDFEYFNALDTIGGDLIFRPSQPAYSISVNVTGLIQLKYIGGNFRLLGYDYTCVRNLSGLSQLNYIGGDFEYYWQYDGNGGCGNVPTSLAGLQQLKHVGGKLRIGQSDLVNLDFLTALESVGGNLEITANDLESIEGLNHAIAIGGELIIENNSDLSECAVQSVCDHINSSGVATIADNMAGCNSVVEVVSVCNAICTGDIIFTTQQEIDDFAINYSGCRHIEGNLIVNGTTPTEIDNLDSLSSILSVSDTLFIIDNQALTDISGLENLYYSALNHVQISGNSVLSACNIESLCIFILNEGTTSIYDNDENCNSETEVRDNCVTCPTASIYLYSQADVDQFPILYSNCSNIPYSIEITGDDISNLNGLIQIEHIDDCLTIESCPALTNLSGLDNLESAGCLIIKDNDGLTDISALSSLVNVQNDFQLRNISVDLTGLGNLQLVGSFSIRDNPTVTDLTALSSLDSLGNIYLWSNENLISLNGLQNITYLRNITVRSNSALTSLNGLNNVVSANRVEITHNPSLLSLEGLNSLTEILGELYMGKLYGFDYIPALQSLSGLDNLTVIHGDLTIVRNEQLNNLEGLNNLISIGGEVFMQRNYALNSLSALENLVSIGGTFSISGSYALASLNGLNSLQTIDGSLIIGMGAMDNNSNLGTGIQDISALSSLTSINGQLYIAHSDLTTLSNSLENLDHNTMSYLTIARNYALGLCDASVICNYLNEGGDSYILLNGIGNCDSAEEIMAACNPMLCPPGDITLATQQEIDAFLTTYPNCTELPGKLIIRADNSSDISNLDALSQLTSIGNGLLIDNTSITNLNGLQNLTTTGYNLVITNNPNLASLVGLENITSTASHLKIENNDALTDLSGLNNITQVGESLLIFDNDNLQNLSGLNALTGIGLQLYLKNNTNLALLSGLENLTSIGTDIRLQNNTNLASFSALSTVSSISGYITVSGHDALTSLMGLENINPDGITQITITNNPNLSMCSASSICGYVADSGSTTFSNNAEGCNNVEEVDTACQTFLPVEMTDPLRVYLKNKTAILQWRTAAEVNNAGFEVQRSRDGINWEKIGWQAGQGNTSTPHSYTYTDSNPLFGTSYYRLKQVDFNGDTEYSNIVSLQYVRNSVTVYPNPVKEQLYLDIDSGFVQKITMYNSTGNQVAEIANPGTGIDVSALPKGMYIIKITVDDEDFYEKIFVE